MNARGHATPRPDPGAFRCLVCRIYVSGTPSGHCPRCGFVPPAAPVAPAELRRTTPWLASILVAAGLAALVILRAL